MKWLIFVLLFAGITLSYAGERPKADITCNATEQSFVYDCSIILTGKKSGTPMTGAKLVIGADMPSMPMAHNVKPATAQETTTAGQYEAEIELEMYGEWLLKIDVSGPTRDRIIHKMNFGPSQ